MENVNVVIGDDNPMILNTLDEMISSEAGLSVIGRADNGKDAIDMIKDTEPDVVLLDLVMPRVDGITVVENIKKKTSMFKNPAFIILSAVGGEQMTEDSFKATISYPPSGAGRMMAGLRTPTCMMLSMVCCMSSSSVTLKGWFLKGRISESGICCTCSLGFCFGTVASPPENAKAAGGGLRLR